jgi:hypothetical protein
MDRILEELARHTDDATRPDVDLYLASGPVLRGRVMKVQQGLATVHLGPAKDPSVSYVRIEQIIAVTVIAGGRSARSLTPSKGIAIEGPKPPSHHDDVITPVNEMSLAAMQAAMATPTPPEELVQRHEERAQDRASRRSGGDMRRSNEDMRRSNEDMRRSNEDMRRSNEELRGADDRRSNEDLRRSKDDRRSSEDMRRSSSDLARGERARADKARADNARAELARVEMSRGGAAHGDPSQMARGGDPSQMARHGEISNDGRRGDDVSAAFSAMRVETGSIPASDPIAEFVASQYDVITPPDPIEPPSLHLGPPMHIEAPTYLGERPQPRAKTPTPSAKVSPAAVAAAASNASNAASNAAAAEATFPMRGDTPKPKGPRTPPPSRPELMRQANTHAEMMSRVLKHRIEIAIAAPLDDDSRRAIGHALPIASDVLLAMFGEPRHRGTLDGVASIELVAGDAEVMIDGARLVIRCSLVDRYTPATLRMVLEAAIEQASA